MSSKDASLYGISRPRDINSGKEIVSTNSLAFTSGLQSLIQSAADDGPKKASSRPVSGRKEDIFTSHSRNSAKRTKRDPKPDAPIGAFTQKHTTNGEAVDPRIWERSKRKMEQKARLYAAMKRGDVEDADERYAVDFDQKWAEQKDLDSSDDDDDGESAGEEVEYVDEFGRTRTGTRRAAERERYAALRARRRQRDEDDGTSLRPAAPSNVIYGDTIQHEAFDLDEPRAAQMAELARKRDKSPTPPEDRHFDADWELRTKGTGFFQFSADNEERRRQFQSLEAERQNTERIREQAQGKMAHRKRVLDERRKEIQRRSAKIKAQDFLAGLATSGTEAHRGGD